MRAVRCSGYLGVGGVYPGGCLPRGCTPPCPVDRIIDTPLSKHYLSATTLADGNKPCLIGLCIGLGVEQWTHHYADGTPSSERHSCLKISPLKEDGLVVQLLSQWDTFLLCVVCRRSWTPSCLTTWSSSNRRRCVGTAQARHGRRSAFCVTLPSPCEPWCPAANLSLGMYYWRLKVHLHWSKSERESDIAPAGFIENTIECIH